jgi:putative membrane protein
MFHAFFLLLPNGIGVLLGLLIGAQLVKVLLRIAPNHTYAVIFGLLCGSAITLIPDFSVINGFLIGFTSFISLVSGMAMAYFSAKLAPEE